MIKLNGTEIKHPNKIEGFRIEEFEISDATRVASGKMTKDIVAKKLKFYFQYEVIEKTDLDIIMNILNNGDAFFTLEVDDGGSTINATVYVGPKSRIPYHITTLAGYKWKNVTFNLIEQ